jgi:hypothetical protein
MHADAPALRCCNAQQWACRVLPDSPRMYADRNRLYRRYKIMAAASGTVAAYRLASPSDVKALMLKYSARMYFWKFGRPAVHHSEHGTPQERR